MTDFNDGEKTTPWGTQRIKMGSNDVNMTPMALVLFNTFKTKSNKATNRKTNRKTPLL
jgi:hypothetical protein